MPDDTPDDLRSLLAKSFDDAQSSTALSDGVVKQPEPKADATDHDAAGDAGEATKAAASGERARGPDGKFVKTEAEEKADAAAADKKAKDDAKTDDDAAAKAKTEGETKPDDDKAKTESVKEDPKEKAISRWSASDKAMFKLQSPEAQDFLLRKVNALDAEYTKKTMAVADLKRDYEPIQKLFDPYTDVLKQKGLTPATVVQRWADVETKLANGQGLDIVAGIIQGYNIDKAQLAQRLGLSGAAAPAADQQQHQAAGEDPSAQLLAQLQQNLMQAFAPKLAKIDQWEQTQQQTHLAAAQQREAEIETRITSFKSAADEKGNLLHPYFEEVEQDMIALAQSYMAMKRPLPELDALYDQAVYANPSTRQALLATQKAAQDAKAAEEARAKAASARRAASSVTGAPGSGQATRSVRGEQSLREQLEEAAADVG
jgi:hypothetical protein